MKHSNLIIFLDIFYEVARRVLKRFLDCRNLTTRYSLYQIFEVFGYILSNGHSRQIRQNGKLLVRMCRMRVTFWRMSGWRMSVECVESGESGWRMSVECVESGLSRVANLANLANF